MADGGLESGRLRLSNREVNQQIPSNPTRCSKPVNCRCRRPWSSRGFLYWCLFGVVCGLNHRVRLSRQLDRGISVAVNDVPSVLINANVSDVIVSAT